MTFRKFADRRRHHGKHNGWFNDTLLQQKSIQSLDKIDQCHVFDIVRIEVMAVAPINKQVDQPTIAKEMGEMKLGGQEREKILGPNAFKPVY